MKAGVQYTYWSSPARDFKSTLLLLHGNPDAAAIWTDLIKSSLLPADYGVIALDLISTGSTGKDERRGEL